MACIQCQMQHFDSISFPTFCRQPHWWHNLFAYQGLPICFYHLLHHTAPGAIWHHHIWWMNVKSHVPAYEIYGPSNHCACLYQYQFTNSQHLCPHKNMTFTYRTYQTSPWWSATNDWEESTLCHSAIAPNKTHHLLLPTMTLAHLTISTGTQPCYGPSTKPTWHNLMLPSTTKPPPTWQQVCIYSHQPEQTKPTTFLCPPLWHLPKICYNHPNISVKLLKYGS